MTADELDPLIHMPTRPKVVATLAARPEGDAVSLSRLQELLGLTPGNGRVSITTVALTDRGRAAPPSDPRPARRLVTRRPPWFAGRPAALGLLRPEEVP